MGVAAGARYVGDGGVGGAVVVHIRAGALRTLCVPAAFLALAAATVAVS
ncbi:hypothetical protein OG474_29145 [Kribbella sp. NBC_01505]